MTRLELDLMEYTHTRAASIEATNAKYGPAVRALRDGESEILADLRAILDGQPLPGPGAE